MSIDDWIRGDCYDGGHVIHHGMTCAKCGNDPDIGPSGRGDA